MTFGYLADRTLVAFIDNVPDLILDKDCLIVALDSNRGDDLRKAYDVLEARMPDSVWANGGIRIDGHSFCRICKLPGIIVPFTAIFILEKNATDLHDLYSLTSESEVYQSDIPTQLIENLNVPGILAYMADGCGLNYAATDCCELYIQRIMGQAERVGPIL